jgi:hypothetical protein
MTGDKAGTGPQPPAADADELALVAAGFPAFRLWRETCYDRTRYVSRARDISTHPHTIVTADLGELAAALAAGQE